MSIYVEHGFATRLKYLESLADDFGLPIYRVRAVADLLGPTEDFDGLISMLDDMSSMDL